MTSSDPDAAARRKPAKPRKPPVAKPATPRYIDAIALRHLDRYSCSRQRLGMILERRSKKRMQVDALPGDVRDAIAATLDRLERLGLLDDRAFAAGRTASLRRKGASSMVTVAKLRHAGIGRDLAQESVASGAPDESELVRIAARRMRIGPFRRLDPGLILDKAEIARLCRRGFSPRVILSAFLDFDPDRQQADETTER